MIEENSLPKLGLAAFDSLRAEEEQPWLDQALVLPPDFDLIAGKRSTLVYGRAGSGKTALFRALLARLQPAGSQGRPGGHLLVRWQPQPPEPGVVGDAAARAQLGRVLYACADALLAHLARQPEGFGAAPDDVQRTLAWFTRRYLKHDLGPRIDVHSRGTDETGHALLASLPGWEWDAAYLDSANPDEVIAELVKALAQIGLGAIHVLVDPDQLDDPDRVQSSLRAFLSSLELFENHHFLYKMIFPQGLGEVLAGSGSVDRRRVDVYPLSWFPDDLAAIVLNRISLAAGQEVHTLDQVCQDPQLAEWLARTGGDRPRGWLDCTKPLVAHYLRRQRPLLIDEWQALRQNPAPPLTLDVEQQVAIVGWRRTERLSEGSWALLHHLYENRNRVCSRHELYFRAYQPLSYIDETVRVVDEKDVDYDHVLDSAISRLRQEIEPDPKSRAPIYLVTVRGKGYKLEHAW